MMSEEKVFLKARMHGPSMPVKRKNNLDLFTFKKR
jgi:hypothetical protein